MAKSTKNKDNDQVDAAPPDEGADNRAQNDDGSLPAPISAMASRKPDVSIRFRSDDTPEYNAESGRFASFMIGLLAAALVGVLLYLWRS
jgi:hypothetical protein